MRSFEVGETQASRSLVDIGDLRTGFYIIRVIQPSGLDLARTLVEANT